MSAPAQIVILLGERDLRPFFWDCVKNGHVYVGRDPCAHCQYRYPDDPATGAMLSAHQLHVEQHDRRDEVAQPQPEKQPRRRYRIQAQTVAAKGPLL